MPIPRVIHAIWVGEQPMTDMAKACVARMRDLNPEMTVKVWGNDDIAQLDCADVVEKVQKPAQKADVMRYEILYTHGGVYLDTDMHLVRSLEPLLARYDDRERVMLTCHENAETEGCCSIGFVAATPQHPTVELCCYENVRQRVRTMKGTPVNIATGPYFFGSAISQRGEGIVRLPKNSFYPVSFSHRHMLTKTKLAEIGLELGDETFAVHLWGHSWR